MIDFKDCVNKRILIEEKDSRYTLMEVTVLEVSPSGEKVKLQHSSGNTRWKEVDDYVIVEVLGDPPYTIAEEKP